MKDILLMLERQLRENERHAVSKADRNVFKQYADAVHWAVEKQTKKDNPKPLNFDGLLDMDGKPVRVVIDDPVEPLKMIVLVEVDQEQAGIWFTNNLGGRSYYGSAEDMQGISVFSI